MNSKETKYNEWEYVELENIPFYCYNLENGDKLIYSVDECGMLDYYTMYLKELNIRHDYSKEEISIMNMFYIASGEDIEVIRSLITLNYKSMIGADLSYLEGIYLEGMVGD